MKWLLSQAGLIVLIFVLSARSAYSQDTYWGPRTRHRSDSAERSQNDYRQPVPSAGKQSVQQAKSKVQHDQKLVHQEEKKSEAGSQQRGEAKPSSFEKQPKQPSRHQMPVDLSSRWRMPFVENQQKIASTPQENRKNVSVPQPLEIQQLGKDSKTQERKKPAPAQKSHEQVASAVVENDQPTNHPSTEKPAREDLVTASHLPQNSEPDLSEENTTNTERSCACSLGEVWMDIIFVLDVSDAISSQDFYALSNFLSHLAAMMRVSQRLGKNTRFGIVVFAEKAKVVADLETIVDSETFRRRMEYVARKHETGYLTTGAGKQANVAAGLIEAQRILSSQKRPNVPGVVILFSSSEAECVQKRSRRGKRLAKTLDEDPCRVATRIKSGNNVLITVAMRFGQALSYPAMNISTPCFHAENSRNLGSDLKRMLCEANCFCLPPFIQFSNEGECKRHGECVYTQSFAASFARASKTCEDYGAHLVEIFSPAKETFVRDLHLATKNVPYWIGINSKPLKPQWTSGKKVYPMDYSNWDPQQKGPLEGQCAYADISPYSENEVVWRTEQCDDFETSYYFSCQKRACDTSRYCRFTDYDYVV